jgi:sulfur carrier protein
MNIILNELPKQIADDATVWHIAQESNLPTTGVAIAVNNAVVPRKLWEQTTLQNGDTVLIIEAAQGG